MLQSITDRISTVKVKPTQKVMLLLTYDIPRLFYGADHGKASRIKFTECDRGIQTNVKRWLHLHPSIADGLLDLKHADGGLGLTKPGTHIPIVQPRGAL